MSTNERKIAKQNIYIDKKKKPIYSESKRRETQIWIKITFLSGREKKKEKNRIL